MQALASWVRDGSSFASCMAFPSSKPHKFSSVHKVFSSSNIRRSSGYVLHPLVDPDYLTATLPHLHWAVLSMPLHRPTATLLCEKLCKERI
jgi:hypothetical protein